MQIPTEQGSSWKLTPRSLSHFFRSIPPIGGGCCFSDPLLIKIFHVLDRFKVILFSSAQSLIFLTSIITSCVASSFNRCTDCHIIRKFDQHVIIRIFWFYIIYHQRKQERVQYITRASIRMGSETPVKQLKHVWCTLGPSLACTTRSSRRKQKNQNFQQASLKRL